ncbi:MAG TPA: lytic transglycosylase domain-containing protein, partial [Rhodospirillales bacterium]|nr:lytic transglycosylase domain-containing protein [Rhodospirillales bacterium]
RDALRQGQGATAYRLVSAHALSEPADYAEAEWFAGWIALRFLKKPDLARGHFLIMVKFVRFPISVAGAAFWAGRAGEAAGDKPFAMAWYRTAAAHPTTFYGRLAAERVSPESTLILPPEPRPSATERAAFAGHELVRATRLLAAHGQDDAARAFIRSLGEIGQAPAWQATTAALASEVGGTGLGVATAKRAMREGFFLFEQAYPLMALPLVSERLPHPVEPALVLAMIRQESEFDRGAVSSAGARGLMQLMPGTAKQVAASLNLPYSPDRLTRDPAYNVKLGRAYLSKLLSSFDGSVALAFAAYNAGPARVRQWLDTYGDPRNGRVDLIDWIEMLPFAETRNYVQRAIENRWVYQARLNGDSVLLASGLGR